MAIQIPNPGTGNGATGDNEFVLWTKVKDNFSNTSHAASRLIGVNAGNVSVNSRLWEGFTGSWQGNYAITGEDVNTLDPYRYWLVRSTSPNAPSDNPDSYGVLLATWTNNNGDYGVQYFLGRETGTVSSRGFNRAGGGTSFTFSAWQHSYNTKNTKLDTNGAIAPSSPTIDLYSDRIESNADGEKMNPVFVRNGVGDYTIKNTTGLRVNDGWYIKIPNDMNGNPKVAITLDDTDGVITLKTYVRIFDMSTFKFVPDLEQPLDIPDGRWIDLRFNEIPVEAQEELPTDGG